MAKRKDSNNSNASFWRVASENYDEVKKWPEWKQSIMITSATASSGDFIIAPRERKHIAKTKK